MVIREFHEVTAVVFGNSSPICKAHFGAQINKANQIITLDMYRDSVETAVGVPGGSFMNVHESIINTARSDLKRAKRVFKRGSGTFSKAVDSNEELEKRLTQKVFQTRLSTHETLPNNRPYMAAGSSCSTASFPSLTEIRSKSK
jgi:hypothetical protein